MLRRSLIKLLLESDIASRFLGKNEKREEPSISWCSDDGCCILPEEEYWRVYDLIRSEVETAI
jgi:hypothetical protein